METEGEKNREREMQETESEWKLVADCVVFGSGYLVVLMLVCHTHTYTHSTLPVAHVKQP